MKVSNRKLIASLMCVSMIAPVVSARQLTADEALQAFMQQGTNIKKAPASSYSLVYTEKSPVTDVNGVYVFSRKDNSGFVLLAADDAIGELMLGYSDASAFDATNMPPALQELLEYYAYCVGESSSSPLIRKAPQAKAPRASIEPICQTTWNQDAPYNNQCPIVNGSRSVTGCVATAMAQVMKVHQWPVRGVGSNSYTFQYQVGNNTYSQNESLIFSQITYDWGNMLNNYSGSYTSTQADAVAALMHSCGVAVYMNYSPDSSGAFDLYAAKGLIDYFGYDKGLRYLCASWFTDEEWDALIYTELAEGRPMLMSGVNQDNGGHEFVCDGYQSSSDYYHINWGWGGYCDGYFSLANLEPNDVGIGGGSGISGFNYQRNIICGIQKPVAGSTVVPVIATEQFSTDAKTYTRRSNNSIIFKGPFYSYAAKTLSYSFGLKLVSKSRSVQYINLISSISLEPYYGFNTINTSSANFPVGEYDVYFVYKTDDTDWQEVYYDKSIGDSSLHFNVTENQINVNSNDAATSATLIDVNPTDANPYDDEVYVGHTYNFSWDITSNTAYDATTYCVVIDDDMIIRNGPLTAVPVHFDEAGTKHLTYEVKVGSDVTPGDYYLGIAYEKDGNLYLMDNAYNLSIKAAPVEYAHVTGIEFPYSNSDGTSEADPAMLLSDVQNIKVSMNCVRSPWSGEVYLAFADQDGYIVAQSDTQNVSFSSVGETKDVRFAGPWEGLVKETVYKMKVRSTDSGLTCGVYYVLISKMTGKVEIRSEEEVEYYNLQGVKVTHPDRGIFLRKSGTRTEKVILP